MTCDRCGVTLHVGDWPYCPHGQGYSNVIGDECDILQTTGTKEPIRFRSKLERQRWLKANGFQEAVRNAGPLDKHCARWDGLMDPQTLENARILVSRPNALKGNDEAPPVNMRIRLVSGEVPRG